VVDNETRLLDRLPHITWLSSSDGTCHWMSSFGLAYVGVGFEALSAMQWTSFVHPDDVAPALARFAESSVQRQPFRSEQRLRRADGLFRWHAIAGTPVVTDDHVTSWIGTAIDIQDHRDLQTRADQALRLDAIAALAAGLAHQFNNWLAVIVANEAFLRSTARFDDMEALDGILLASDRITNLVGQLGAFPRVDRTRILALDASIQENAALLRNVAGSRLQLDVSLQSSNATVACEIAHLKQILITLLERARDATGGMGSVRIRTRTVEPNVVLDVHDDGPALSPLILERIFEPFTTTVEASGLGLHVTNQLVHALGGSIEVTSDAGGTTFSVSLPRARRRDPDPVDLRGAGEVILLVDDMPEVLSTLERATKHMGYVVRTASNGAAALALVEREAIDVIVSDISMPVMNGIELATRAIANHGSIVILMTGHDDTSATSALEGIPVLRKPFTIRELALMLQQVLRARRDGQRA
jgi:PAS domain S-box-containing protein